MPSFITKNYNFADCYPLLAKHWDHQANHPISPRLLPVLYRGKSFWFSCQNCNKKTLKQIPSIVKKGKILCPSCQNIEKRQQKNKTLADVSNLIEYYNYKKNTLDPKSLPVYYDKPLHWKCPQCGEETFTSPHSILSKKTKTFECRNCSKIKKYKKIGEEYLKLGSINKTAIILKVDGKTVKRAINYLNLPINTDTADSINSQVKSIKNHISEIIDDHINKLPKESIQQKYKLSKATTGQLSLNLNKRIIKNGTYKQKGYKTIPIKDGANIKLRLEHRHVAALMLGRDLAQNEQIHHVDLNKANNSPDNLAVGSPKQHGLWHKSLTEALSTILPELIKNNIIHFTTNEGYTINFKAKKLTKILSLAKP